MAGEAENKENHREATAISQQPLRRGYRRPYNYRRRPRPPSAPAQDGKEVSAVLGKCGRARKYTVSVLKEFDGQVQRADG